MKSREEEEDSVERTLAEQDSDSDWAKKRKTMQKVFAAKADDRTSFKKYKKHMSFR